MVGHVRHDLMQYGLNPDAINDESQLRTDDGSPGPTPAECCNKVLETREWIEALPAQLPLYLQETAYNVRRREVVDALRADAAAWTAEVEDSGWWVDDGHVALPSELQRRVTRTVQHALHAASSTVGISTGTGTHSTTGTRTAASS